MKINIVGKNTKNMENIEKKNIGRKNIENHGKNRNSLEKIELLIG